MDWQRMNTAPEDGTMVLLYVDWAPLVVVGFFGPGEKSEGLLTETGDRYAEDDGEPAWRVGWDCSLISHGFDSPTHWAPTPRVPVKMNKMGNAPRDGTKIDVWLEIPASPRSMGMSDEFWITDCWVKDGQWVHRHRGKDEPLYRDYMEGWLPAGSEKPECDNVHKAEP